MRKRLVGVVFLSVLAASCRVLPFWPFQREEKPLPSEDVIHLARNFCGVLVPDRGKLYGCRWYRDSTYNNELTRCLGIWERDVETGEMRPLWMDTLWDVPDYEVSRDYRYLFFIIASRIQPNDIRLVLMDLETKALDTIVSQSGVWQWIAASPYTAKRFYSLSDEAWGEVNVLWSIDFRTHQMTRETSVAFPYGFYIVPGRKGDSVVVDNVGGSVPPVNYLSMLGVYRIDLPDSFFFKNLNTQKLYRLTAVPPREAYWYANQVWWVHDRDSLLICTDWGGYHYPKRYDLWLIRNVTKHLQEVSP